MRRFARISILVLVPLAVGVLTSHLLIARAVAQGTPEYAVRLAGEMAGLFAAGLAAVVVGLGLLVTRRRPPVARGDEQIR